MRNYVVKWYFKINQKKGIIMFSYIDTIQNLPVSQKRALLKSIREMIKEDVNSNKVSKIISKQAKENAKRDKINAQILAAQEKLAKLQSKLAS